MFLEPLPVVETESGFKVVKTAEALAKIVGVASALGDSSRYLWLKLPYCENYEVVARSTTLPILLLGGAYERIERLEEEKKTISDDIRDVYAEGKGNGFDVKALRQIVRLRKQDPNERAEAETILETYMQALGMI